MVLLALIVTRSSVTSLQAREGLPVGNQVVGWFVLGEFLSSLLWSSRTNSSSSVASLSLPFFHRFYPNNNYLHRLMVIFLTFSPTFIILTISWEGLFYFVFCMTLVTWVRLEHAIYVHTAGSKTVQSQEPATNGSVAPSEPAPTGTTTVDGQTYCYRALTLSDTRVALFFFFLLQSGFFSTGNVASISTFSLDSVRRLIPIFDPFAQGALLILQILIPFAIISANLGILNRRLEVAPSALFMVVMSISDVMTLNFFYMVRDEGSWLDIGMTISHFCIASALCTFVAGLEFLSEQFVSGVDFGRAQALGSAVVQAVSESAECGHESTTGPNSSKSSSSRSRDKGSKAQQ
jgi:phosphatidylinositol glycan class N